MRGVVSPTVSVSSFLPSSSLPFEGASVNDFPLQGLTTLGPQLVRPTLLVVWESPITQDIAAV